MEQLNRIDIAGEGSSKLEDRFERITYNPAQKEKWKIWKRGMEDGMKSSNICLIRFFGKQL